MKNFLILLVCAFISFSAHAVSPTDKSYYKIDAKTYFFHLGKTGKTISFFELAHASKKEIEEKTGNKLNFFEALSIKKVQKKLKKMIDKDGNIKVSSKDPDDGISGEKGFHLGGFALGLILSWVGLIIAYLIKDEKKKNRVKWAWIGFAVYTMLLLILIAAFLSNFRIP